MDTSHQTELYVELVTFHCMKLLFQVFTIYQLLLSSYLLHCAKGTIYPYEEQANAFR